MVKYTTLLALANLGLLAGAAQAQGLTFAPIVTYSSGTSGMLTGVAVADLNADGKPDLLAADSNTGQVSVLLGNGNGTFQAAKTYATGGGGSRTVVAADVNGDGRPDVLVGNSNSGTLGVLLGNANGTLQAAVTYSTGSNSVPVDIAVADVNGDSRLDVVAATYTTYQAAVLVGNGNGTFQAARTFAAGSANSAPYGIAAADVNGDGKPDLLTANFNANAVGVLLGNGDATFQAARTYPTGTSSATVSVKVADVNGDGKPDLLTANNVGSIAVQLGNGNGSFQTAVGYSSGPSSYPSRLALADVDGDGRLDVVAPAGVVNGSTLGVLLGNGNGTFQTARTYSTGAGTIPYDVAVADVNGDGRPDLLTVDYKFNTVGVLLNTTALPTRAALPGATATLSPNPTEGGAATLTLAGLPAAVARVQATLLDATGRAVARQQLPAAQGAARAEVPTASLPAGLYVLHLTALDARGAAVGELPARRLSVR